VVAGGESDDAAFALFGRELQQPVGRAPQLERSAGLQAFAFEPDSRAADLTLEQRRLLNEAGDTLRGFDDILPRDLGIIT